MKFLKALISCSFLLLATSAYADPALIINSDGCNVPDANGNLYFVPDCEYKFVFTDGSFDYDPYLAIAGRATLPEGAVLDKKAVIWTAETLGFAGCFTIGDESHFVVTPKGVVNWWCRTKKQN